MKNSQLQEEFFSRLAPNDQLFRLLDFLPEVSFFVKDAEGRFMAASTNKKDHFGLAHQGDAVGKSDHDFFSPRRADSYRSDDLAVMESGIPIVDRMESAPEAVGSPRMVLTTKIPLHDREGNVIGVAGFSRPIERLAEGVDEQMASVMTLLHSRYFHPLSSTEMAAAANLSVSQMERRFRAAFGTSPRKYLVRIRVEAAARKLAETRQTVSEIAIDCGFSDHAHLSRSFRKILGMAPTDYRARYRSQTRIS